MSTSQNKKLKVKWVNTNLYQICSDTAKSRVKPNPYSRVIKAEDLRSPEKTKVQVKEYTPIERKIESFSAPTLPQVGLDGLNKNLKTLADLQGRFKFLLEELEELVTEEESR